MLRSSYSYLVISLTLLLLSPPMEATKVITVSPVGKGKDATKSLRKAIESADKYKDVDVERK